MPWGDSLLCCADCEGCLLLLLLQLLRTGAEASCAEFEAASATGCGRGVDRPQSAAAADRAAQGEAAIGAWVPA